MITICKCFFFSLLNKKYSFYIFWCCFWYSFTVKKKTIKSNGIIALLRSEHAMNATLLKFTFNHHVWRWNAIHHLIESCTRGAVLIYWVPINAYVRVRDLIFMIRIIVVLVLWPQAMRRSIVLNTCLYFFSCQSLKNYEIDKVFHEFSL